MKQNIWCLPVILTAAGVSAAQFSDDFSRDSIPFVTGTQSEQIGAGWKSETTNGAWRILDQQLTARVPPDVPKPVLYNTSIITAPGAGFRLSGTVILKTDNKTGLAGLVCNYQNSNDQYVFRYGGNGTVQFLRKNSAITVFNQNDAFKHVPGTPYHLTILCEKPYVFKLTIQSLTTGETVFSQEVTDGQKSYNGGYGGFYSSGGSACFDDLMFETLEAPPAVLG